MEGQGVATAQESFKTMLREHLGPSLRALGLKGSGQAYTLPSESFWSLIGFQKSAFGDSTDLRFTGNCTVVRKETWSDMRSERSYLPERPAPNTFYGSWLWKERIGTLMPGGQDKWWAVSADQDTTALSTEVLAVIRHYALPAMRSGSPDGRARATRRAAPRLAT